MNLLDLAIKIALDDQATSKMGGISSGIKSAASGAAAGAAASMAAIGTAVVAIGKQALDSYSDFEQLTGGVETIFKDSAPAVEQYASQAFQTAGMSANEYMDTVTGFSASLIQSLGGDTAAAADKANEAVTDMSDNANIFGTSMGDIQNAYQGFAKQNYTMLDNLKLGYGGTQEEMQRLLSDANAYNAAQGNNTNYQIGNYANIVDAIHTVQVEQGIAGDTAREASETIAGSVAMAKGAWQNWITGLGDDNADMGKLTGDLVNSVSTAAGNIVPRLGTIFTSLVSALPNLIGTIASVLPTAIEPLAQSLITAIGSILQMLYEYISTTDWGQLITDLLNNVVSLFSTAAPQLLNIIPAILSALMQIVTGIITFLADNAESILMGIVDLILQIVQVLMDNIPTLLEAAGNLLMAIVQAIPVIIPPLIEGLLNLIFQLVGSILSHIPDILGAAISLFMTIVEAIGSVLGDVLGALGGLIGQAVGSVANSAYMLLTAAIEFMGGMLQGIVQAGVDVITWFTELPGNIVNAIGNVGTLLLDVGKSIIQGLWDGMVGAFGDFINWVGGIADNIAENKGPLPYDRRVLVPNGKALIEGLKNSMEMEFNGSVIPMVERMAPAMQTAMGTGYGYTSGSRGSDVSNLRDDLRRYTEAIVSKKSVIMMDTGAIVGATAPSMDSALGERRSTYDRGFQRA